MGNELGIGHIWRRIYAFQNLLGALYGHALLMEQMLYAPEHGEMLFGIKALTAACAQRGQLWEFRLPKAQYMGPEIQEIGHIANAPSLGGGLGRCRLGRIPGIQTRP